MLGYTMTTLVDGMEHGEAVPYPDRVLSLLLSARSGWMPLAQDHPLLPSKCRGRWQGVSIPRSQCQQGGPNWDHAETAMGAAWLPPLHLLHMLLAASAVVPRCSKGLFRKTE